MFGRGHHSGTLLNLLGSFFHLFENVLPVLHAFSRVFVFALLLILRYIPRQLSKRDVIVAENFQKQLLDSISCC